MKPHAQVVPRADVAELAVSLLLSGLGGGVARRTSGCNMKMR